uniref:Uncharacterized protein n=1 Tax=Chaetoceros debilis TaxID=122233 RepID=A0A7S3PZT7_9STRA|mmetsp:Transcript_18743/g.28470  ORF Transcript_18743/g.28470 Transcript_18743/m.28470 type:complete len:767 (+) Transcript_18743:142-2442(+)|eukprot:CAMPEP_0194085170 /NCGR_PEP_ID=MMETSP0149-20130528/16520_1 /TAXON_ID=122233 /ORGANISM="Chaetoceros debilis, Strain MM31A-1" /LENGTH=766 /DNA_ID=CAMNT_0038767993 /DNA_START=51 /DNA_END=2351 /DNA_ORIENTATION=+
MKSSSSSSESSASGDQCTPKNVAVIGCGPGGMFFLHALAKRRKQLEEQGDLIELMALPNVTCFEKSPSPGGVWRCDQTFENRGSCNIHDDNDNDDTTAADSDASTEGDATSTGGTSSRRSSSHDCMDSLAVGSLAASVDSMISNEKKDSDICHREGGNQISDASSTVSSFSSSSSCRNDSCSNKKETEDSREEESASTNMYEGLWINGIKEGMEFFDYTYDEHFQSPQPTYIPRKDVLEYVIARVTQHEDIFEDVQFNTTVESVTYDESLQQFIVRSSDNHYGRTDDDDSSDVRARTNTQTFDKVIWSAGLNGKPKFVKEIQDELKDFQGQIVHSSEMNKLANNVADYDGVKGKKILMIGDSYSASDLALQCIKLGAEKIYISSRSASGNASHMGSWPEDRVELLSYTTPYGLKDDDTKTTILYKLLYPKDANDDTREIEDVSIVIFCTGYSANLNMVDPSLHPWDATGHDAFEEDGKTWSMPTDWKMKDNSLTDVLGHVEPPDSLSFNSYYHCERLHKRMLIKNPNLFYLFEVTAYPILELDIAANQIMKIILEDEDSAIPTQEEMVEINKRNLMLLMDNVGERYSFDHNFRKACDAIGYDHWYHDSTSNGYRQYMYECVGYNIHLLADSSTDAKYPLCLGTREELNETGKKFCEMTVDDLRSQYLLWRCTPEEKKWKTFRDSDPSPFSSLFTGTKPVPMNGKWIELDDAGNHPGTTKEMKIVQGEADDNFKQMKKNLKMKKSIEKTPLDVNMDNLCITAVTASW